MHNGDLLKVASCRKRKRQTPSQAQWDWPLKSTEYRTEQQGAPKIASQSARKAHTAKYAIALSCRARDAVTSEPSIAPNSHRSHRSTARTC
eukprot:2852692-Pyramimonas_sp.AAC.1